MKYQRALLTLACTLFAMMANAAVERATAEMPVRLKNFREIYASYVAITGLDARDSELMDLYKLNIDRLPKQGQAAELSSNVILATTELSGLFCKKAFDKEKVLPRGERRLFGLVDLNRGPRQFSNYLKGQISDHFADAFWQRSATEAEKGLVSAMVTRSAQGGNDTAEETAKILKVLCVTYGSSLAFLTK